MNSNNEYKDKIYEDAGIKKGSAGKATAAILALLLALVMTLASSCGMAATSDTSDSEEIRTTSVQTTDSDAQAKAEMFTERDLSGDYDENDAVTITLGGTSAQTSSSNGVTIDGSTITITAEGVYIFSGTLSDGQIIVDADDSAKVQIVLNGA